MLCFLLGCASPLSRLLLCPAKRLLGGALPLGLRLLCLSAKRLLGGALPLGRLLRLAPGLLGGALPLGRLLLLRLSDPLRRLPNPGDLYIIVY